MNGRLVVGAVVSMLLLAGCGLQQDLSQVPSLSDGPTGPATPISAPTLSGTRFDWSSTREHVVVLDFWGSWCGPCNAEQPELNTLASRWAVTGVIFLGVDENESSANGAAYERSFKVPYPSVNDASEVIASEYNVIDPPTVIIIDAKGNIVDRFLGTLAGVSADLKRLT
ncbi:MAG: TlpA family protein disulfide reductase [Candidatus Dormibacteria bacterium]